MNYQEKQLDGTIIILFLMTLAYLIFLLQPFLYRNRTFPLSGDKKHFDIVIGISGENINGGIYFIPLNTRLGRFLKIFKLTKFDKKLLNTPLKNAQIIVLRENNAINIAEMTTAQKLILDVPVDINRVTLQELTLISGIGIQKAKQIIQYREKIGGIKVIEDLMKIRGIKEKTFKKIKGYFCIRK